MTLRTAVQSTRAALLRQEAATARQLANAHRVLVACVQPELDRLTQQLASAQAAGETVNTNWLLQQQRMANLLAVVHQQTTVYGTFARHTVAQAQQVAVGSAAGDTSALLHTALDGTARRYGVSLTFNRVPVEALDTLVNRASNGAPLSSLFDGFGAEAAQAARATLLQGVGLGYGPAQIASQLAQDLAISRNRALVISRTETLDAYRDAALAGYQANSDVLDGWVWSAEGANSCAACVFMDGSVHGLDESLDSHPGCRCSMQPLSKSYADILEPYGVDTSGIDETSAGDDLESGADWFAQQDAATQRSILGSKIAYDAYAAGDVTLADFVGVSHDKQWGTSIYQKSAKQLGLS